MTSSDFSHSEDFVVSTEKLRLRLLQEGIGEAVIKDCESIMLPEISQLRNQLKAFQDKHIMFLETLRQLEVTTSIYNIIIGKIYCDHYGTMRIKGSGSYSCKLKFKEQSVIDRNPHQVHGFVQDNRSGEKVAMLVGKWDEAMYYVLGDPTTKPKGYDPISEAVFLWERGKSGKSYPSAAWLSISRSIPLVWVNHERTNDGKKAAGKGVATKMVPKG